MWEFGAHRLFGTPDPHEILTVAYCSLKWFKGFYHAAIALQSLGRDEQAVAIVQKAAKLFPEERSLSELVQQIKPTTPQALSPASEPDQEDVKHGQRSARGQTRPTYVYRPDLTDYIMGLRPA